MSVTVDIRRFLGILLLLLVGCLIPVSAQIWQQYRNLEGHWKFSIGDDPSWKQADFDDTSWDYIKVPGDWERQGYDDYNGYAWYRKTISLKSLPPDQLYLRIGGIDDADEVFLNGRFVNRSGNFPPHVETAYDRERAYRIPQSYWQEGDNLLAIRVYDFYNEGGIIRNPVALYTDGIAQYLTIDLSGQWHFTAHHHNIRDGIDLTDPKWTTIQVPGHWDDQGWPDLDGVAWYSRQFVCPGHLKREQLFMVLGRIDDQEIVYLNGKKIGDTKSLRRRMSFWDRIEDYRLFRAYPIPDEVLKYNGKNTISIKVNDLMGLGGIYEGPVGIMTRGQMEAFYQVRNSNPEWMDSFWEWLWD